MNSNNVSLEICANNRPVREFSKNGKIFIEARENTEFTLKIKNNNNRRVLIIPSIDNINVLSGKVAGQSTEGYIVDKYGSLDIKGWRVSDNEVNSFVFSNKDKSYANIVGGKVSQNGEEINIPDISNCGVIGIKVVFEKTSNLNKKLRKLQNEVDELKKRKPEKEYVPYPVYPTWPRPWDTYPYYTCNTTDISIGSSFQRSLGGISNSCDSSLLAAFNSEADGNAPEFNLGTSFGQNIQDKVVEVSFKSSDESFIMEIFYSDRKSLEKYGISFENKKQVNWPTAFEGSNKYCTIPKK